MFTKQIGLRIVVEMGRVEARASVGHFQGEFVVADIGDDVDETARSVVDGVDERFISAEDDLPHGRVFDAVGGQILGERLPQRRGG